MTEGALKGKKAREAEKSHGSFFMGEKKKTHTWNGIYVNLRSNWGGGNGTRGESVQIQGNP